MLAGFDPLHLALNIPFDLFDSKISVYCRCDDGALSDPGAASCSR